MMLRPSPFDPLFKEESCLRGHLLRLLGDVVDATNHVEGALRLIVVLSTEDLAESADALLERDKLSGSASEDLGDVERLGHELLDLAGTGDGHLVVLGKLVHAKNGNDVLETLVVLEELLDLTGDLVVLVSNDTGVHHTAGGVEGIDGGVDTELGDVAGEHGGRVEMGEGGRGGGIGEVISGDVDSLDRGDGSLGGGGDALLEPSHVSGEGRLVPDGGGDAAEKGGHLGTGLGETEDVVNEEEHILSLLIAEVLSDGESGKGDAGAGSRGLVHLPVDKGGLGSGGAAVIVDLDDASLDHLMVEIVALACPLANTGEDGVSSVVHGNVVDELHDNHSLSDSGSSEEADLSSLGVGGEEVHNLDASDEDLLGLALLNEGGSGAVEGGELLLPGLGDGTLLVDGLANDVEDAAERVGTDGDLDGGASVHALLAAHESLGGLHGNSPDRVLSKVLGNLKDHAVLGSLNLKGVEDLGESLVELSFS